MIKLGSDDSEAEVAGIRTNAYEFRQHREKMQPLIKIPCTWYGPSGIEYGSERVSDVKMRTYVRFTWNISFSAVTGWDAKSGDDPSGAWWL